MNTFFGPFSKENLYIVNTNVKSMRTCVKKREKKTQRAFENGIRSIRLMQETKRIIKMNSMR